MNKITNSDPTITGKGLDITLRVKQLALLAAAEESYSQAAGVLFHPLKELLTQVIGWQQEEQLKSGLHLLEEAMECHNRYMESLQ